MKAGETGLHIDSIAIAHQIRVLSKERLEEQCGVITDEESQEQIKKAIRLYLDL